MNARVRFLVPVVFWVMSGHCVQKICKDVATDDFSSHTSHAYTLGQLNVPCEHTTPLVSAIMHDNLIAVRTLVDAGVDVIQKVAYQLPIEYGVQYASPDIVKYLWAHGAPLSTRACALAARRPRMAQFFINVFKEYRFGSIKLARNCFFLTRPMVDEYVNILLLHVQNEHQLIQLIRMGADVHYHDEQRMGTLDYALQEGRYHIAKILYAQGARARADVVQAAQKFACESNYRTFMRAHSVLEQVVQDRADTVDVQLFNLIKDGSLSREFLKKHFSGVNRRSIDRTFVQFFNLDALSYAVACNNYEAACLLLKFGAQNVRGAFVCALKSGSKELIKLLLKFGATFNSVPEPVELIIQHNVYAADIIEWLAPRIMRITRNRALLFACTQAQLPVVQILVCHGAQVNYVGLNGNTPLYNALIGRSADIVAWLLAHGAHDTLTPEQHVYMKNYFPAGSVLLEVEHSL